MRELLCIHARSFEEHCISHNIAGVKHLNTTQELTRTSPALTSEPSLLVYRNHHLAPTARGMSVADSVALHLVEHIEAQMKEA